MTRIPDMDQSTPGNELMEEFRDGRSQIDIRVTANDKDRERQCGEPIMDLRQVGIVQTLRKMEKALPSC